MGKYISQNSKGQILPAFGKAEALIADGAIVISKEQLQVGDVVVVENGVFDAALLVDEYQLGEFASGRRDRDDRNVWFLRYEPASKMVKK